MEPSERTTRIFPQHIPDAPVDPLPPAGHDRREELLRRRDQLLQEAEEIAQEVGMEAIDPATLEPDTEILSILDNARVTNPKPGYTYRWVQFKRPLDSPGLPVEMHLNEGWEVVKGNDPECVECKNVETTRTKGDLMLMRIRTEVKERIEAHRNQRTNAAMMGDVHDTVERASKKAGQPITLVEYDNMDPATQRRLERVSKQQFAKQVARGRVEQNIRQGTIPGRELRR